MITRRALVALSLATGLAGSRAASGAALPARLVFIHGRGQAGLSPKDLQATWSAALKEGARADGATLPPGLDVSFPFYGDLLEDFVRKSNLPLTDDVVARGGGVDDDFLAFQADVAQSLRTRAGVTDEQILAEDVGDPRARGPLNWRWVQSILRAIDKHGGGLSSDALQRFTRDVYLYTTVSTVRDAIDDVVRASLDGRPTVIVAHSLGTVVAYNVLRTRGASLNIPLLVTLGSPLAIRAIRERFLPLTFPEHVKTWYNAYDTRDVVSLYALDAQNFPVHPSIINFPGVRNGTPDRHGIDGYLSDPRVAAEILTSLRP